jgi:hypothetical protein
VSESPRSFARDRTLAHALVLLALVVFLWVTRGYEILGMDTYPGTAAGILRGPEDLLRIFTSPDVVGRVPYPFHGFYRPFVMLSFGLDHALYGTSARGYFVTQALLFGACAVLLYVLARTLLGPRAAVGPLAALVVFLVAPSNVETLAVVARRSEMICGIFSLLALRAQVARSDRGARGPGVAAAALTLLAMVAKTTAIALVPALFVILVLRSREAGLPARVRAATLATVPHVLAVALAFAVQLAILGEMGGHVTSQASGGLYRLPWALGGFARWLLVPQPGLRASLVTWLLLGALAAGLVASGALLLRARRDARDVLAPVHATILGSVVWLLGLAALYGAVGLLQGWYVFVPTLAYALLFGAVCEALLRAARTAHAALRAAAAATLAVAALWVAWEARYSMLAGAYPSIPRASALVRTYLDDLRGRIAAAPDGTVLVAPPPPRRVPTEPGEAVLDGPILIPEYALASWAECAFPDRRFTVDSRRSDAALEPPEPGVLKLVFRP